MNSEVIQPKSDGKVKWLGIALLFTIIGLIIAIYVITTKNKVIKALSENQKKEPIENNKELLIQETKSTIESEKNVIPPEISKGISEILDELKDSPKISSEFEEIVPLLQEGWFKQAQVFTTSILEGILKNISGNKEEDPEKDKLYSYINEASRNKIITNKERHLLHKYRVMRNKTLHPSDSKFTRDEYVAGILFQFKMIIKLNRLTQISPETSNQNIELQPILV